MISRHRLETKDHKEAKCTVHLNNYLDNKKYSDTLHSLAVKVYFITTNSVSDISLQSHKFIRRE